MDIAGFKETKYKGENILIDSSDSLKVKKVAMETKRLQNKTGITSSFEEKEIYMNNISDSVLEELASLTDGQMNMDSLKMYDFPSVGDMDYIMKLVGKLIIYREMISNLSDIGDKFLISSIYSEKINDLNELGKDTFELIEDLLILSDKGSEVLPDINFYLK